MILRGFDAQPVGNLTKAKSLGANAMHRYDSGPQKNVLARDWMKACRDLGLAYIVQGTLLEAQKFTVGELADDKWLMAISQDDEPDLNRYDKTKPNPNIFRPEDIPTPHGSIIGWTKPEVLVKRYNNWKSIKPVSVNFAGQNLTNPYYTQGQFHKPYIKGASDYQGHDYHIVNNRWETWKLYQIAFAIQRINSFGGNCKSCYFEMSDQVLDSDANGGPGRGPTPFETSTEIWIALTQGCTEVWGFTQQIGRDKVTGKSFDYWSVTPEVETQVKKDFGRIAQWENLIEKGKRTLTDTPVFQVNKDGTVVYPTTGVCQWELDGQILVVELDYTGKTEPQFRTSGDPAPLPTPNMVSKIEYDAIVADRDNWKTLALNRKTNLDAVKSQVETLKAQANKLQEDLQLVAGKRDALVGSAASLIEATQAYAKVVDAAK